MRKREVEMLKLKKRRRQRLALELWDNFVDWFESLRALPSPNNRWFIVFSFWELDFSIKEFEKRFLMLFVYWCFLVWDSAFLKVKIVEPHFLSKRVISGLFLKAKTEEEEFAELNVQELGVWTEINEEQVGPKSTLFFWKVDWFWNGKMKRRSARFDKIGSKLFEPATIETCFL
jgi:hypothetical protein